MKLYPDKWRQTLAKTAQPQKSPAHQTIFLTTPHALPSPTRSPLGTREIEISFLTREPERIISDFSEQLIAKQALKNSTRENE